MLRAIFIAVAAAILISIFFGWRASKRPFRADSEGWFAVRPNSTVYAVLAGSTAFSLLAFYDFLFVGYFGADADEDMFAWLLLAVGCMTLSLLLALNAFWPSVKWKGRMLRVGPIFGSPSEIPFDDLESVECRSRSGVFILRFRRGRVVKLSVMTNGTRELLVSLGDPMVDYAS